MSADKSDEGSQLRKMPAEEFVRRLRTVAGQNDVHYAFWLGAGCSVSAGIPGAGSLVADRWLPQLQHIQDVSEEEFEAWVESKFPGYDPRNPAAKYGAVMEELFIQPEARQREVEALCDGRFPGFGYAVLAALLARSDGLFNVALTTNFDDLIADAMYVFTEARPLVIPDESLAAFIRPTRMRPLVVKVHGDHRLSPRNTQTETASLKRGISEGIANLLHDRGVIFVGYGGNDRDIAELLAALPSQALPLGVWWVSRNEPEGTLCRWLGERRAIWVESPGFEELMLLFHSEFDMSHPTSSKFDRLFAGYIETYGELERRVGRIADSDPQASSLKHATARVDAAATDWWGVVLQASRIENEDSQKAEELYKKGIRDFPSIGAMRVEYGSFLMGWGRFDEAQAVAQEAVDLDRSDFQALRLLAHALMVNGKFELSRRVFAEVVELAPNSPAAHAEYGLALAKLQDIEGAMEERDLALSLQPTVAADLSSMALLLGELKDYRRALQFHQRAVEKAPESTFHHANLAGCLIAVGDFEQAESEVQAALDLSPPIRGPLRLELLFYRLVAGPARKQQQALAGIKLLIEAGIRSPNWDLHPIIAQGREQNHADADWLESLAEVINKTQEPNVLDGWERWKRLDG